MKKKPIKLNNLSDLGKHFDLVIDAAKVQDRLVLDLSMYGCAIMKTTPDGIEHVSYEDAPKELIDKLFNNPDLVHENYKGYIRRQLKSKF